MSIEETTQSPDLSETPKSGPVTDDDPYQLIEKAKLNRNARNLAQAIEFATKARELAPNDGPIASETAWILHEAGRSSEAEQVAMDGLAKNPDAAYLYHFLCKLHLASGKIAAAKANYRQITELANPPSELVSELIAIYESDDEIDKALELLDRLAANNPVYIGEALRIELEQLYRVKSSDEEATVLAALSRRLQNISEVETDPNPAVARARDIQQRFDWVRTIEEADLLFDELFYLSQLDPAEERPWDIKSHYLIHGARRRISPSPLFDPLFYLQQVAEPSKIIDPFYHYITVGYTEGFPFHADFDLEVFERLSGLARTSVNPLLHVLKEQPRIVPSVQSFSASLVSGRQEQQSLFEIWMRKAGKRVVETPLRAAMERFCDSYPKLSQHAEALRLIFDFNYYGMQLLQRGLAVASDERLIHFHEEGWRLGLDPHPLFRTKLFFAAHPEAARTRTNPLLMYIENGAGGRYAIHPVYDPRKLPPKDRGGDEVAPLLAYLSTKPEERPLLSVFFSPKFYKKTNSDVDWAIQDPLLHYLSVGAFRGRWPNPVFDPKYYSDRHMTKEDEAQNITPLEHFERTPEPRPKPLALFDPVFYLGGNLDLKEAGACPVSHFVAYGLWEDRKPNEFELVQYIYRQNPTISFADRPPLWEYFAKNQQKRKRLLFVGHEGSRTGAPGILLRIVEHFAQYSNVECLTLLDQGGPLFADYALCSHTCVMPISRHQAYQNAGSKAEFDSTLYNLLQLFSDNPPVAVICNSAEIRIYAEFFKGCGLPVIFLVHEIAGFYGKDQMEIVIDSADKIVFPADFVLQAMRTVCPPSKGQSVILPQGLLRETYGDRHRGDREAVFRGSGLRVTDKDIIVLGCGTIDGRKGFDHFVEISRIVRARNPETAIKFVWVGGRPDWWVGKEGRWDTIGYWAGWEINQGELAGTITVIPEVTDTEPFFVNSDLFLMTSRADPFPCVVHEAMASRVPVLCFANTTGSTEAILPDAGLALPYPNLEAMADAIISLAADPAKRAAMGEVGRQRVKTKYRFHDYGEKLKNQVLEVTRLQTEDFGTLSKIPSERKRIYFTSPNWSLSGVNTFTEALVNYLNEQGFEAEILLTVGRFGPPRPTGELYNPAPELLPKAPYRMLQPKDLKPKSREECVRRFLLAQAPCVLVPNYDYDITNVARDLPSTIGVVGIAHADDTEHYDHCYNLGPFWNRIVAVSDEIAKNVVKTNPTFSEKLQVIRYGLEPPDAAEIQATVVAKVAEADPIRLVYAGRFEVVQKRIFDYCTLARLLSDAGVPFHLSLIGEGTKFAEAERRVGPYLASGVVSLPGRLDHDETIEIMRQAHIVLVLSDYEGFPLSLIEGLQNGCVPIVYDMKSGIPEVLTNGQNGFIVPHGDLNAVVAHVVELQRDEALRMRMMQEALATSERKGLTVQTMGSLYAGMLDEVFAEIKNGTFQRPPQSNV